MVRFKAFFVRCLLALTIETNAHIHNLVHTLKNVSCINDIYCFNTGAIKCIQYTKYTYIAPCIRFDVYMCLCVRVHTSWLIVQVSSDFFRCFHEEDNIKRRKKGNRNAFLVYFVTKEPIALHGKENKRRRREIERARESKRQIKL